MQSTTSSTRTFMTSPSSDKKPSPMLKLSRPSWLKLPWLIIVILLLISGFLFWQYHQARQKLQAESVANSSTQLNDVVSRVGKLIILPKNETPTLVTVKDVTKLQNESFYAGAKNGDITLIYPKEQKAILYRPSANIIVNVAHVTVTGQ